MNRRKFITTTAAGSMVAPIASANSLNQNTLANNEIYELRTYEMAWGGNQGALLSQLKGPETSYLRSQGAKDFLLFIEQGQSQPIKYWTLAVFPDFASYQQAIIGRSEESYLNQSKPYIEAGKTYTRISSSLVYAIDGLKEMKPLIDNAGLFELRIYEGVNEDAVRRKINMFNNEELELFYKVDLNPVFFGDMVIGPYVPSLVYMLNYRDMEHRDSAWANFLEHPDWNTMKVKAEYSNTVSNIRRVFLELA